MEVWKKAKELFEKQEFESAIEQISILLVSDPYHIEAIQLRASIHRRKERYNESLIDHETLVNLLPNDASVISERGVAKFHVKDIKGALSDLDSAQEMEPNNPYRYSSRAYIRAAAKDIQGAISDYKKTLELSPDDSIAHNNLGLLEEQLGRMDAAKGHFNRADSITKIQVPNTPSKGPQKTVVKNKPEPENKTKPSLANEFLKTIKLLFTKKSERQEFIKFIKGGNKK